jgi:hypothetical protein
MPNREPMQDEELIRLSLEAFHIQLQFENTALQIGVPFWVSGDSGEAIRIDPVTHQGDVGPLWSLIGERVRSITWADEIEIAFTGGARLRIPAAVDKVPTRGTLMGRGANDENMVEDF